VLTWNAGACDLFGRDQADAVGRPAASLGGGHWAGELAQLLRRVQSGEVTVRREIPLRRPDGTELGLDVTASRVGDGAGRLVGAWLIARDITARERTEQELRDRSRFEALIRELSARFAGLADRETGLGLDEAPRALGEFMALDHVALWELSADQTEFNSAHFWEIEGLAPPRTVVRVADVPDVSTRLLRGQSVSFPRPDAAAHAGPPGEERCFTSHGLTALLLIPLMLGGAPLGAVSFGSLRGGRDWPPELIERLWLIAEIFANALARQRGARAMDAAYAEIGRLKDQLHADNAYPQEGIKLKFNFGEIVGQSAAIRKVLHQVEQVAGTGATVLILGETGTGKELLAREIHGRSPRNGRPLVMLNCAALPSTLVESELFGREKGAYTGALTRQAGRFEMADGSTLFLDEVGELPLDVQAKLLRVLQSGEFERLGGTKTLRADVRILAATNRDLEKAVKEGRFREDLYYRLNVFPIRLPPLRDRPEDIPLLVRAFVKELGQAMSKTIDSIPRQTLEKLKQYAWPGNIRELRNVIERSLIVAHGPVFDVELPQPSVDGAAGAGARAGADRALTLEEVERRHILAVLERTRWRVSGAEGAAALLGLKPTTLESRMAKLDIRRQR
jgi:formate hydrogenlyase transcriptional activator